MELTIGDRSTFFELKVAYDKIQFGVSVILENFMELTIGDRSTFFELKVAYDKIQFGVSVNNVEAMKTHILNIQSAQKWYTTKIKLSDEEIASIIASKIPNEVKQKMIDWAKDELSKKYSFDQFHHEFSSTKELLKFIDSYCKKGFKKKLTIYALGATKEERIDANAPCIAFLSNAGTDSNKNQQGGNPSKNKNNTANVNAINVKVKSVNSNKNKSTDTIIEADASDIQARLRTRC
ncbi:hypothetical protein CANINC_003843 [Pichia inconspicua]|uniref:Uncharacterized protein n=1 Tax=Pichia inconspicua TaxID=52247 RepID=A0A4T0WXL6_9ASCO|nr:hypothetical protein CANINC_003843 [[Candida] inconspicua]